jgi:hypothetical protein
MTEPTRILAGQRRATFITELAAASQALPAERIAQILRTDPADLTFSGEHCWRHRHKPARPTVHPYDECGDCLEERFTANDWREQTGRPIQLPHIQAIYQPQLGDD